MEQSSNINPPANKNVRTSFSGRKPGSPYWVSAVKKADRITGKMLKTPLVLQKNRIDGSFKPTKRTNLSRSDMDALLATHVIELVFRRRIKPPKKIKDRKPGHMKQTRRMLCTAKWDIISNPKFRKIFNWKKPKTRRGKAWYSKRKLFISWCLTKNAFRMFSSDKYVINACYPLTTPESAQKFITFYRRNIYRRSQAYKDKFSDQG